MVPRKTKREETGAEWLSPGNLGQLCGIEDNIAFAGDLIAAYGKNAKASASSKSPWGRFRAALDEIERRHADKKLNLAVVGEFSTGKSTFINALLRRKLLVSSALQGTTVADTVIEQGDGYAIEAVFPGRKKAVRETFAEPEELKARLAKLTTDESVARQLRSVRVTLPTECFVPDVRIIDTPGTNAIEAWHEEAAVRAIREQADVSVILLAADRLVTNTALAFAEAHLRPLLAQSVFVVTHMDHIDTPEERKRQLDYIRLKISRELDLDDPVVLPYASPAVLDHAAGKRAGEGMQCFLDESLATERTLHAHMARVRTVAQAKRMLLLLDALYGEIQGHVEAASREQEEKLRVLEKTKAADLQDFVDFHKNLVRENLSEALESVLDRTDAKIGKACRSGKQEILASVRRQEDAQSLKRYLENGLMRRFKWEADKAKEIAKNSCRDLAGRLQSELRQFYGAFAEEYRQQGIAELDLDMPVLPPIRVETVDTDDFGNALRYAAAQLDKEFGGSVVGGSIGGVLGFVGGGPLGAAAGAWLGNKIGKFLARDAGFQNTCADRLSGELEGCFSRLRQGLVGSVESCGEEIVGQSSEMIDQYHVTYRAEIGKLVRSQQAQIRAAQTRLEGLRRDTAAILERNNRLEDVRTRLDAHSKQGEGHKGTRKERKK